MNTKDQVQPAAYVAVEPPDGSALGVGAAMPEDISMPDARSLARDIFGSRIDVSTLPHNEFTSYVLSNLTGLIGPIDLQEFLIEDDGSFRETLNQGDKGA